MTKDAAALRCSNAAGATVFSELSEGNRYSPDIPAHVFHPLCGRHTEGLPPSPLLSFVFHSDDITPVPRIAKVMPSAHSGGVSSQPIASAMNIFDAMKTGSANRSYFREVKRCRIAASAKVLARKPRMEKKLENWTMQGSIVIVIAAEAESTAKTSSATSIMVSARNRGVA